VVLEERLMNPTALLMKDLEESISQGSAACRESTLQQVVALFIDAVDRLNEEQIAIFDGVMARLAHVSEPSARVELARALAGLAKAPPGIVRALAHDAIEIARPVLIRSLRLKDSDLVAVAVARGSHHRRAIAQRSPLSEPVCAMLVAGGDRIVLHNLARNGAARLSPESTAVLMAHARQDEGLRTLLETRRDPPREMVSPPFPGRQAPARGATRDAGLVALPGGSANRTGREAAGAFDYREALDTVGALALMRPVDEVDIAGFAEQGRLAEVVCAIASCAHVSLATAERLFTVADPDLILLLGKAKGWAWATLHRLLGLRDPEAVLPDAAKRWAERFDDLDPETAQRVLHSMGRDGPAA
jgi:hypothetical protein